MDNKTDLFLWWSVIIIGIYFIFMWIFCDLLKLPIRNWKIVLPHIWKILHRCLSVSRMTEEMTVMRSLHPPPCMSSEGAVCWRLECIVFPPQSPTSCSHQRLFVISTWFLSQKGHYTSASTLIRGLAAMGVMRCMWCDSEGSWWAEICATCKQHLKFILIIGCN